MASTSRSAGSSSTTRIFVGVGGTDAMRATVPKRAQSRREVAALLAGRGIGRRARLRVLEEERALSALVGPELLLDRREITRRGGDVDAEVADAIAILDAEGEARLRVLDEDERAGLAGARH